jgi:hypothetical protein
MPSKLVKKLIVKKKIKTKLVLTRINGVLFIQMKKDRENKMNFKSFVIINFNRTFKKQ